MEAGSEKIKHFITGEIKINIFKSDAHFLLLRLCEYRRVWMGGTNVSCQLKFRLFVSCKLNFRPFVSCQLAGC